MSPELRVRWRLVPRWLFAAAGTACLLDIGWSLFCAFLGLADSERPPAIHLGLFGYFFAQGVLEQFRVWNLSDETKGWFRDEPEEVRRAA